MPETRVITLRGRRDEYGPRLENRPDILYTGRRMTMGGWDLPQSPFANRWSVKQYGLAESLDRYVWDLIDRPELVEAIRVHRGGVFACWCGDDPGINECHASILAWVSDGGDPRHLISRCRIQRSDACLDRILAAAECEPDMPLLRAWENVVPAGAWAGAL